MEDKGDEKRWYRKGFITDQDFAAFALLRQQSVVVMQDELALRGLDFRREPKPKDAALDMDSTADAGRLHLQNGRKSANHKKDLISLPVLALKGRGEE